jgi:hypothetical protein
MDMVKTKTVEDLLQVQREADGRVRELAAELRDLPGRIQQAAREDAKAKARAARSGEDTATATVSELLALRQRGAELPMLLWGARVGRLEAALELQKAELVEVVDMQAQANGERQQAELEYQRARAAWEEAVSRHAGLAGRGQDLQRRLKQAERDLAQLEAQGPPA